MCHPGRPELQHCRAQVRWRYERSRAAHVVGDDLAAGDPALVVHRVEDSVEEALLLIGPRNGEHIVRCGTNDVDEHHDNVDLATAYPGPAGWSRSTSTPARRR